MGDRLTVFILGLDGASLENIMRVMKRTELPNFEKVINKGRAYDLRSIYPYVTGPAWTSIFSGVNPGKHGIFDQLESDGQSLHPPNLNNCEVPFLWDYLSWAGKKILVMGVQFVHPSPQVNGTFVTGRFSPRVYCYPDDIKYRFDFSGYDFGELSDAKSKWKYVKKYGTRGLWERSIEQLRSRAKASISLIDSAAWDAVILVDSQPDEVLHLSYGQEDAENELFNSLDNWLGELENRVKSEDTLLLLSDHGFSAVDSSFMIDEWLRRKGFLVKPGRTRSRVVNALDRKSAVLDKSFKGRKVHSLLIRKLSSLMGLKDEPKSIEELAEKSRKEGSKVIPLIFNEQFAWLRLLCKSEADRELTARRILREAEDLKSEGILKNVFRSTDLFSGKYTFKAPGDLLIELSDGICLAKKSKESDNLVSKLGQDKRGTHRLNGMLVFYGSVMPKESIQPVLYDIVPTVLRILRIPCPMYVEGKALV